MTKGNGKGEKDDKTPGNGTNGGNGVSNGDNGGKKRALIHQSSFGQSLVLILCSTISRSLILSLILASTCSTLLFHLTVNLSMVFNESFIFPVNPTTCRTN